jgi:hypothetical protein
LVASGGIHRASSVELKAKLKQIVSMLTRMALKFDGVSESTIADAVVVDYDHEHRGAEHEHEGAESQNVGAPKDGLRGFRNWKTRQNQTMCPSGRSRRNPMDVQLP